MTRLSQTFTHTPVFMPYYPVGYPDIPTSVDVIEALATNGADLIEVGLSFSDPLADGPVIQHATQVALEQGVTTRAVIAAVSELRRRGVSIPLVLMGYYNPILAYGLSDFIRDAAAAGADGFIIPDLPPEESKEFEDKLSGASLPLIKMLAPTTPGERMENVARNASGFIYLVSVAGVTGLRTGLPLELRDLVDRVRQHTSVPVCVGFGISTPQQAREVGAFADGVIVGSACVREIGASATPVESARNLARAFRAALREPAI